PLGRLGGNEPISGQVGQKGIGRFHPMRPSPDELFLPMGRLSSRTLLSHGRIVAWKGGSVIREEPNGKERDSGPNSKVPCCVDNGESEGPRRDDEQDTRKQLDRSMHGEGNDSDQASRIG